MDQQRRFITFFVLSLGAMYLWLNVGLPYFYPELIEQKAARQIAQDKQKQALVADPEGTSTPKPEAPVVENNANEPPAEEPAPSAPSQEVADFPARRVTIGTLDPKSEFFMQVELEAAGAAINSLQLNDNRYRELTDRERPLQLLGSVKGSKLATFDLRAAAVDNQLIPQGKSLDSVNWNVVEEELTDHKVVFEYPAPDGNLVLRKIYELHKGDPARRDTSAEGYELKLTLEFRNTGQNAAEMQYALQGPVGFPLEDEENTRRYLAVQAGFLNGGGVRRETILASTILDEADEPEGVEEFRAPLRYLGVDGQFFATLLIPDPANSTDGQPPVSQPMLISRAREAERSLISFQIESAPVPVQPGQTVSHEYTLFAGPKRTALLQPYDAEGIIEYGWFGWISKIMLAILHFFHDTVYLPYGISIIMLTVMVRGAMYPISRKHALAAKKMKELQPKFEEIKKKHEGDKEKLAQAQMDLMKESGFFAGCLPMLLQIPIFIGLYQALSVSVDLRMAEFLWIDNLASPDKLFTLPFSIPFLGNDFNLLPILTVGLFIAQQKMFSPPPANEEQALQQKMMSYMMIFIGFMFYRVPAGLCIYFIASSLWAIAERKILDLHDTTAESLKQKKAETGKKKPSDDASDKKPGWFREQMAAIDAAANPGNKSAQLKPAPSRKGKK
ncbi:membrane protein insertase YidC [Rubinisphaera margarita]|uniref:membrane protein insertase YidC n=1 Tax=Rubinisphaera margarita TaxID=2909586 RepID=UPI001EE8EFBB|nr:membrane protein insertase YidC [Rubinisphaera margarita]MCG6154930.1 membrane protein insertase YidC [Rubinisphaera margarita]